MYGVAPALSDPVRVGLVGAGRIGTSHATLLARRVPGARLVAVADPRPEAARALADSLGCRPAKDADDLFADPEIEAVVVTASSEAHADLVVAAATAGKAVFCEKPMGLTVEDIDRGIAAASAAGVALQVGFNRRFSADFAAAHQLVLDGRIGTPQLMRSLTRDPGLANPAGVPPWTVFLQTLIHDFDSLLWLNPGARAVEVNAMADALVAPDFKGSGLLDTAVVTIGYDNGAIATAEASFSAAYGYDVRGEVFGSAGMVTAGTAAQVTMAHWTSQGVARPTRRSDTELFADAYAGELAAFCAAVRDGGPTQVGGEDARAALRIALACIEAVETGGTVAVRDSDRA